MTFPKTVQEKIELAAVYYDDGAPHTAARNLLDAAQAMKSLAEEASLRALSKRNGGNL